MKLSYEVQIYDGFLGRGNERIEERGEDRKEGGVLERGRERRNSSQNKIAGDKF